MMNKIAESTKAEIIERIRSLIDIREYYDLHNLTLEAFLEKYGHWGFSFDDCLEIRFTRQANVHLQIAKLLDSLTEYFFFPINDKEEVYSGRLEQIKQYYDSNSPDEHFILVDPAFDWLLVKTEFNQLIGVGEAAKSKMAAKIHLNPRLCFDGTEIMYQSMKKKDE